MGSVEKGAVKNGDRSAFEHRCHHVKIRDICLESLGNHLLLFYGYVPTLIPIRYTLPPARFQGHTQSNQLSPTLYFMHPQT